MEQERAFIELRYNVNGKSGTLTQYINPPPNFIDEQSAVNIIMTDLTDRILHHVLLGDAYG